MRGDIHIPLAVFVIAFTFDVCLMIYGIININAILYVLVLFQKGCF
jgi:hypothetical protein